MDRAYLGPRPFESGHADIGRFFGRAEEAKTLANWWQDNRLIFAVGPAGRGKTSLLNAGALPILTSRRTVFPIGRLSYGATFPSAALPSSHNPYTLALLQSWAPGESVTLLAGQTIQQFLDQRVTSKPVLAAIDPIDELLAVTSRRRQQRLRFLRELSEALESSTQLHLLILGREEAVDLAADALGNGARYEVPRLTRSGAFEAISRPLAALGRPIDDEAVHELIGDLGGDGIDPVLLQVACASLESSLPAGNKRVTLRDVRNYGDVDTALTAHLRTVISGVADDHGIAPKRLRSWLLKTFVTELGTRDKAYEGKTATARIPNAVTRAFEDRQVLISRIESGTRWYELLSDRLIQPLRDLTDVPLPMPGLSNRLPLAEHAHTVGELDLAQKYATEITRNPGHRQQAEAYSLLGNLAVEQGKPGEAEEHYQKAMERFAAVSDLSAVAYQLAAVGQTLLIREKVIEAVEALHGATIRIPGDVVIRVAYAHALWQLGESRASERQLTQALNIDGGNAAALAARGEILADLGEAASALLDLNRVSGQDDPRVHAARALALATLGNLRDARKAMDLVLSSGTQDGPALLYSARTAALTEDDFTASDLARQAIAAGDPPLPPPQRAAAQRLMRQGSRQLLDKRRPAV